MRKTLSVIGCGLLVAACGRASPLPASPTIEENQRAGGQGWKPDNPSRDLAAFVDRTSYLPGSAVEVHAGAASPTSVIWELWRLGYYGGAGGRMLLAGGPTEIPASQTAVLDGATGAVSAPWPMAFVVTIPASAPTGVYVVKLVSSAGSTFAPLVVREPVPRAPILYTVSTNTYQAYNTWGGTSLYVNRRSDWSAPRAYAVSFDRPYAAGAGTGDLWDKDRDFITFAEGQGYDMAYATDTDLDAQPDLVARRRMLVVQGHSEYWTAAMRDAFETAIAARTNVAFFAANNAYWQVRFASDARRVLIGYKEFAALDPMAAVDPRRVTTKWRDPRVNRPENAMIGEMYGDWIWTGAPLVVADPSSWLWTGAGVDQGTAIPGVYGDEVDRRIDNGAQPAGVQVVGSGFVESQGTSFSSARHVQPSIHGNCRE